jgi:uroporphyrinogen-III synthase
VSAPAATLPLAGLRIVVTRARAQADGLSELLRTAGATPLELPAIEIRPAPAGPLDDALRRLDDYDWVVLTSVNGVRAVIDRLDALGIPLDGLGRPGIAAIGPATAAALRGRGIEVDIVPERFVAEAVVEGLVASGVDGTRVLLPRADIARDVLPRGLRAAGAVVDVVVAYETCLPPEVPAPALNALRAGEVDAVTFGSPSAVRNVVELVGGPLPAEVVVACIGPITAAAVRDAGLRVDVVAQAFSMPGLVAALAAWYESRRGGGM